MLKILTRRLHTSMARMVRVLNVAEKNDAAKSLSEIMARGRYRRRDGFSRFNKIYEFEYNILNQQNVTMTMTSVSGHLLTHEFAQGYRKWYSCNPVTLFEAPVTLQCPQDYQDIKRTLEKEVRGCQMLIIWTDCDREGENIGFEIIQVCKAVKPNLKVYRARFSEITPQAVQRACVNLIPPDKNVSDAVDVRSELDLRIGAAFTRFQTMRLQKTFPDVLAEQLISYGSCQFPTLGFVVERYKQVQAFIAEPFWKLSVHHETDDGVVEFAWKRSRLFNHLACLAIYEHCLENPVARVSNVKSKPKSKWRPQPLDTVELEKLASRKLKIGAKETMKIAEKLYTQGFISYPRTETNIFPKDLDLCPLVEAQTQDQRWGEFAGRILERGPTPRNGNKTDQAHPPIHPLKYTNTLQGNEAKVYEFIVRHFLACCSQDAQGQETIVDLSLAEEMFIASGLMILARNYLDVYPYDTWSSKTVPHFEQGEEFRPKRIEMNQGETSAPQLLTEADLISLMEKHGIGTDATHAEHIETIKSRLYVGVRQDGRFVPGELGMGLVEGYDAMGYNMSKPHLRAELERDLIAISDGRKSSEEVRLQQIQNYKHVFVEAVKQANKIDTALSEYFGAAQAYNPDATGGAVSLPVMKCRTCGKDMCLKQKRDGKSYFISCMGYPDCREAIWFPESVTKAEVLNTKCNKCHGAPSRIKFNFKRGSVPMFMSLEYEGCIGGCDADLTETLGLRMQPPQQPAQGNNTNDSGLGGSLNGPGYQQQQQPGRHRSQGLQDSGLSGSQSRSYSTNSNNRTTCNTGAQVKRSTILGVGLGFNHTHSSNPPLQPGGSLGSGDGPGGDGGSGAIVCACGIDAKQLTVRKEGPNTGRQFYICMKQDGKCDFFLWADSRPEEDRGTGSFNTNSASDNRNSYNKRFAAGGPDTSVECNCGHRAKQCTVQKEGHNKGRQFYGCPHPRGQGCNFFQWQDEVADAEGGAAGGGAGRYNSNAGFTNNYSSATKRRGDVSTNDNVQCNCGDTAKSLTVQKEGPNKGRQFFACTKPRGQGCNFFQWQDEGVGGTEQKFTANSMPTGGRKRTASGQTKQPGPKRTVTCSLCRQPGHRKNKCPQAELT